MSTVLPREEAVETIFSKILASPEASGRLSGVFYDHIDDDHRLTDNDRDHFLQVLFHAYQNGDISALLLELCGRSMFDHRDEYWQTAEYQNPQRSGYVYR